MSPSLPPGAILVVGTGMIGTSVGLALRRQGVPVHLADVDPVVLDVAVTLGAGSSAEPSDVGLVVVAVPPRAVASTSMAALERWPGAVVTDVCSVKVLPLTELLAAGGDVSRYVGSHPMAGSERSGPTAASAGLFTARAWAVTPHETSLGAAQQAVQALAVRCGAVVVELSPEAHDAAVARVSHLPHLMAALTAAQLSTSTSSQLALAGQGVRDVTRIAASDPSLWTEILTANATPLSTLLAGVRRDLDEVAAALRGRDEQPLTELLARANRAAAAIATVPPAGPPDDERIRP